MTLYSIVAEIFEGREYNPCWFSPESDCGNWIECDPGCPLVELRVLAGIVPTQSGNVLPEPAPSPDPDNPAVTEAAERKQYAQACRAGEIAKAGEREES